MTRSRLGSAILALSFLLGTAAFAQLPPFPAPTEVAPEVRSLIERVTRANPQERSAVAAAINEMDGLLASTQDPVARGMLQVMRVEGLKRLDRQADARSAIEEAIRLLPDHAGPLLMGVDFETYADRPAVAADYLLRAAALAPAVVRNLPRYDFAGLMTRLRAVRDHGRQRALAERFIALGWTGDDPAFLSDLARLSVIGRLDVGDMDGARAMVTKVSSPVDLYELMIDRRAEPVWATIEQVAGPRLETAWSDHLARLHLAWSSDRSAERTRQYGRALDAAGQYGRLVRDLAPAFVRLDRARDYDLIWVASPVAEAMARTGRWEEGDALYARGLQAWPLGGHANAINLAANRAVLQLRMGQAQQALRRLDVVLADANRRGGEVGRSAITGLHLNRLCALHALDRGGEASSSAMEVLQFGTARQKVHAHLCAGDLARAKATVLQALDMEEERLAMLLFLQPPSAPPLPAAYERRVASLQDALRTDAEVLAAVRRHGRILPFAVNAGASEAPRSI